MKILICGDSFCLTDSDFPGMHWSEKILSSSPKFEIANLARGGSSNAMIALQLLQGLRLQPDFVIFSFTSEFRYEFDEDIKALPADVNAREIASYLYRRYTTTCHGKNTEKTNLTNRWIIEAASENMEMMKNYMYILLCFNSCKIEQIPFCYSMGGFNFKNDSNSFANNNYIKNFFNDYRDQELMTNLWDHQVNIERPYFHVPDENVHTLFANQCIDHILRKKLC